MRGLLFDENLASAVSEALIQTEPEYGIRHVGDGIAPPLGAPDPELLIWIEEFDFMLVTNNRRSMPVHLAAHLAAGRHVAGILQVPKRYRIQHLVQAIEMTVAASLPGELEDRITYLTALLEP